MDEETVKEYVKDLLDFKDRHSLVFYLNRWTHDTLKAFKWNSRKLKERFNTPKMCVIRKTYLPKTTMGNYVREFSHVEIKLYIFKHIRTKPNGYFWHYTKEIKMPCHTKLWTSKGCDCSPQHTSVRSSYSLKIK